MPFLHPVLQLVACVTAVLFVFFVGLVDLHTFVKFVRIS